ncbi:hypothetical protein BpHYR1_023847 [Brachionus plicatilis]|uniref:RNA-directed DNA polymerase from mobile element jockey-like n=1 Tax=Brachionus plicatilis TaxID=10195 RepID=A0A3M7S4W6_BRAPC|nr:hypothetical protein BpHYR1_023847 [Brachionus plicatilis]
MREKKIKTDGFRLSKINQNKDFTYTQFNQPKPPKHEDMKFDPNANFIKLFEVIKLKIRSYIDLMRIVKASLIESIIDLPFPSLNSLSKTKIKKIQNRLKNNRLYLCKHSQLNLKNKFKSKLIKFNI